MTFAQLWTTWKGITTVATSLVAVITMVYGASVWVNDFVFTESQAGEMLEQQHVQQLQESFSREQGDLESQLQLLHFRLSYLEAESEYRQLSDRENRMIALVENEITTVEARIVRIQCFRDPTRDVTLC